MVSTTSETARIGAKLRLREALWVALWGMLAAGAVAATVQRLWLGWGLPLWLDEVFTAVIAGQPTWGGFWREAWLDCNPPLYYLLMKFWVVIAGDSNLALRLPSVAFTLAAAVLPLIWSPGRLPKWACLVWAALICMWWPGFYLVYDARGYALLLFLSVAQAIAFAQLIEKGPSLGHALLWCALASLAILTHYFAGWVGLAQGLIYLAVYRARALGTVPAALPLVPVLAWASIHLPRVAEYARPDVAWYSKLDWRIFGNQSAYLLTLPAWPIAAAMVATCAVALLAGRVFGKGEPAPRSNPGAELAALSGVLGWLALMGAALFSPSSHERYLTPMVPLVLLGLVVIAVRSRRPEITLVALTAEILLTLIAWPFMRERLEARSRYGWQREYAFVAEAQPQRLILFWDHPGAKIMDPGTLRQLGAFFFRRDGHDIEVTIPQIRPGEDPNPQLLAKAGPNDAILWLYNAHRKSVAKEYPPAIRGAMGWTCAGPRVEGSFGAIACRRAK